MGKKKKPSFRGLKSQTKPQAVNPRGDSLAIEAIEAFIHGNIDRAYEIIKQPTIEDPRKISDFHELLETKKRISPQDSEAGTDQDYQTQGSNQVEPKSGAGSESPSNWQDIEELLANEGLSADIALYPDSTYTPQVTQKLCEAFAEEDDPEIKKRKLVAVCKICLNQGELDSFEAVYTKYISHEIDNRIQFLKGAAQENLAAGRNGEARRIFEVLIGLDGFNSDYINDVGLTHYREGEDERAIEYFDKAISLSPENLHAHHNRALAHHNLKDYEKAEKGYHRALSCLPTYPWSYTNLARLLEDVNRFEESEQYHRLSISTGEANGIMQENFGSYLKRRNRYQEAITHYVKAIELGLTPHIVNFQIGHCQIGLGEYNNATHTWLKCLEEDPKNSNYAFQCGWVYNRTRMYDLAIDYYTQGSKLDPGNLSCYSNCLYLSNFSGGYSVENEFEYGKLWEKNYKNLNPGEYLGKYEFERKRLGGRKLKIGFITAELGNHAIAYFLKPILQNIDENKFELYGYDSGNRSDPKTEEMRSLFSFVRDIHEINDEEACNLIRNDELDILFETTSHMRSNRMGVLLRRAAPIQAHTIGYHGTSGISQLDYFVGDTIVTPLKNQTHFLEKIYQLNRTWVCYDIDEASNVPDINWSNTNRSVRLGCFNNLEKVSDETLENWAQILLKIKNSSLILKDGLTNADVVRERILGVLENRGVTADRIEWIGYAASWQEHMNLYNTIDVALDTQPLNSGTTAFDALAMGVPIVSLPGNRMGSLLTASILTGLGKREWIANSPTELVDKVEFLVSNQSQEARKSLRALYLNSMLCDAKNMAKEFMRAIDSMTKEWHKEKVSPGNSSDTD